MAHEPLSTEDIIACLDECLEVEFSFVENETPAQAIVKLPRREQDFILNLTRRVAGTNIKLAYQLACHAIRALEAMEQHMVEAWAMTATDHYDRKGLLPAMSVIRDLDSFIDNARKRACGAVFEEQVSVLLPFLHGLSGRKLKLNSADRAYTDTETIYLPPILTTLPEMQENFLLYKATLAHHWAQIQYGTFRVDLIDIYSNDANSEIQLKKFYALEALRLDACIQRELPGLYRDMQMLKQKLNQLDNQHRWQDLQTILSEQHSSVHTSIELVDKVKLEDCPELFCYQGELQLHAVREIMNKRIEREKACFRVALSEVAKETLQQTACDETENTGEPTKGETAMFEIREPDAAQSAFNDGTVELQFEGELVPTSEHIRKLMSSIFVDFGEIPSEHLTAAGPDEYDLSKYEDSKLDPGEVWKDTYHKEGVEIYNEWNVQRQHYHKNWCVLREIDVQPVYDSFYQDTLTKHKGLLKSLRHSFEILRGEDKLLKKQPHGDDIDIDAFVEACGDVLSGMEMPENLFTKIHKEKRNVAVIFMVDMSGSTCGWINQAEKESLILLAEVLEILGDRYAIYGFSGMTRKRCELFKIKTIDEDYDDNVRARISNIKPQDYTRMGVFIRHITRMFNDIEADTKLLITLSDGKPDDYDTYRGEYGVEDTRQSLYEAKQQGIHSFCITLDEKARDYLPHMYGAANYAVIDDVAQLPLKVSDIYRRLTTG